MFGPVALHTATLDLRAASGRGTISSAVLAIDNASARASGTFGFRPSDALDLHVVAQTADAGALAKTLSGKTYDAAGQVTATLGIGGTPRHPQLTGSVDAASLRYERLTLAHVHAEAGLTETRATLRNAEVDLTSGRLLASGEVPVQRAPAFGVPAGAPLSLAFTADHAQLGQFAALLPSGTTATGELDGTVSVVGTRAAPGLRGTLTLSNASFVGPQLRSQVTSGVAELVFSGRDVSLENASASVGGGTISASGRLMVPDLQDPARTASANLTIVSRNAALNAPAFLKGRVNGTVTIARASGASALVGGNVAFSSTRIPPTLILPKSGATPAASALPIPVSFDLGVDVGDDVRVQGGPVDIGAKGHLQLGGTLAAPTLQGKLESTGGTLSFYRTFQLQYPSSVAFEPSNGVIPYVDANATTTVDNPPTDVTLQVTGPATGLNVTLSSDPSYSREQILGLLVGLQAFGAVNGVQTVAGVAQPNPFQAAAAGELGTLLTQNLLEPFSSQLGSAVGLSNLAINYSPYGGVSVGAQKKLLKNVNAVFAESFNYPPRQSIGLRANPNAGTAIQLTFFSQPSSNRFNAYEGAYALQSTNAAVSDSEPASGTSGFSLSFQRRFP
jgi:translocation and assembly module TamB